VDEPRFAGHATHVRQSRRPRLNLSSIIRAVALVALAAMLALQASGCSRTGQGDPPEEAQPDSWLSAIPSSVFDSIGCAYIASVVTTCAGAYDVGLCVTDATTVVAGGSFTVTAWISSESTGSVAISGSLESDVLSVELVDASGVQIEPDPGPASVTPPSQARDSLRIGANRALSRTVYYTPAPGRYTVRARADFTADEGGSGPERIEAVTDPVELIVE
jgi:hypothetical protein